MVRGTQIEAKPIEVIGNKVYIKTDIKRIETEDFSGWEYEEIEMTIEEYFITLKERALQTEQIANYNGVANQELLELLVEIGVL